jgi:hypothetical protein
MTEQNSKNGTAMPYSFFKKVSMIGLVLSAVASVVLGVLLSWRWSCGVLVGYFWVFLNSFFLFQLLGMSFTPGAKRKDRILILSILKFPVLYVAGFFILQSRVFPVLSILAGLTLFFLAFFAAWIGLNLSQNRTERSAS